MAPRVRNWCFTDNNPDYEPMELPQHPEEKYCSWQLEKGESGTLHIQGYIELKKQMTLSAMKAWLPGAHFEPRKGTREEARDYTMKDDSRVAGPFERGEFGQEQGKRMDLEAVKLAVAEGKSKREIYDLFPFVAAKHPRFVDQLLAWHVADGAVKIVDFNPRYTWQQKVLDMLSEAPHERQVLWLYDAVGGKGKTHMSKYLVDARGAFYTNGGKAADVCYAYNGEPIVIFDYMRDYKEFVGYAVIEQIKNGILFSHKYESGMKRFNTPHVICMANFMPDISKLSHDRWCIIELKDDDYEVLSV